MGSPVKRSREASGMRTEYPFPQLFQKTGVVKSPEPTQPQLSVLSFLKGERTDSITFHWLEQSSLGAPHSYPFLVPLDFFKSLFGLPSLSSNWQSPTATNTSCCVLRWIHIPAGISVPVTKALGIPWSPSLTLWWVHH